MSEWAEIQPPPIPGVRKAYRKAVDDGELSLFVGREQHYDEDWPLRLHVSIAHQFSTGITDGSGLPAGRLPTWDEVKDARYRFMPSDMVVAMILPPPAEYVDFHKNCFHLWEIRGIEG